MECAMDKEMKASFQKLFSVSFLREEFQIVWRVGGLEMILLACHLALEQCS